MRKPRKYHVVTFAADTWEVWAPDEETAMAMAENGEGEHISGSLCEDSDCYLEESDYDLIAEETQNGNCNVSA
jgi:hypothetical protein